MELLTSGDIELNPGPEKNLNSQTILSVGPTLFFNLQVRARIKDLLVVKVSVFSEQFSSVIWLSQSSLVH